MLLARRISKFTEGQDTPLLDIFKAIRLQIYQTRRCKMAKDTLETIDNWYADVATRFAALWRASVDDVRWEDVGPLALGVLRSRKGRARRISGSYKRHVMIESRNHRGEGISTPRQMLVGLSVGQALKPAKRLGLQKRLQMQGKRPRAPAAKSQPGAHAGGHVGALFETYEQFNYFYDSRPSFILICIARVDLSLSAAPLLLLPLLARLSPVAFCHRAGKLPRTRRTGPSPWTRRTSASRSG